jgi:hypothetical protein
MQFEVYISSGKLDIKIDSIGLIVETKSPDKLIYEAKSDIYDYITDSKLERIKLIYVDNGKTPEFYNFKDIVDKEGQLIPIHLWHLHTIDREIFIDQINNRFNLYTYQQNKIIGLTQTFLNEIWVNKKDWITFFDYIIEFPVYYVENQEETFAIQSYAKFDLKKNEPSVFSLDLIFKYEKGKVPNLEIGEITEKSMALTEEEFESFFKSLNENIKQILEHINENDLSDSSSSNYLQEIIDKKIENTKWY